MSKGLTCQNKHNIMPITLRKERLVLSEGGKEAMKMNVSDVILNLVDRLIAEKENKFMLQQKIKHQSQQVVDEQENKD